MEVLSDLRRLNAEDQGDLLGLDQLAALLVSGCRTGKTDNEPSGEQHHECDVKNATTHRIPPPNELQASPQSVNDNRLQPGRAWQKTRGPRLRVSGADGVLVDRAGPGHRPRPQLGPRWTVQPGLPPSSSDPIGAEGLTLLVPALGRNAPPVRVDRSRPALAQPGGGRSRNHSPVYGIVGRS